MTDGIKDSGSDKKQDPVDTSLTSDEEVAFDPNGKGLYGKTQAGQDEIQKDVDQAAKAVKDAFDKNENPGEALSRKVHDEMGNHFGKTGYLNMYEQMLNQALKDKKSEIENPSFPDLSIHFDKGHGYATIIDSSKNEPIKIAANISSDTDSKVPVIQISKSSPENKQTVPLAGVPVAHNFKLDNQQSDIHPPQQPIAHQEKQNMSPPSIPVDHGFGSRKLDAYPPQHPIVHQMDSSAHSNKKGSGAPIHEEAAQIIKGLTPDQMKQKSEEFLKSSEDAKAQAQALQSGLDKLNQSGYRLIDISKDPNKPNLITEAKLLNIPDNSLSDANKRIKKSLQDDLLNVSDASVEDWPALKEHRQVLLASMRLENDVQSTLAKSEHDQKLAGILQQLASANQNVHDLHLQKPNTNKDTAVHHEQTKGKNKAPDLHHGPVPPESSTSGNKVIHRDISDVFARLGISKDKGPNSPYNKLSTIFEKGTDEQKLTALQEIKNRARDKKEFADRLPSPSIDDQQNNKKAALMESIALIKLAGEVHQLCPKATIADQKELNEQFLQWKNDADNFREYCRNTKNISNLTEELKSTRQMLNVHDLSPVQISAQAESLRHQSDMTQKENAHKREDLVVGQTGLDQKLKPMMQELMPISQQSDLLETEVKQMLKIDLNDKSNDIKKKLSPGEISKQIELLNLVGAIENAKGQVYETLLECKAEIGGNYLDRANMAVQASQYFGNSAKYTEKALQCSEECWHNTPGDVIYGQQDRETKKNQLEQLISEAKQGQSSWLEASKKYSTSARVLGETSIKQ